MKKKILYHKYKLFIIGLMIIGAILRFRDFPGIWIGDVGRDYLVAKHIVLDKTIPLVGPYATGIEFHYPPYYYYSLGLLYIFFSSLFKLIGFFTLLHLISIVIIFEVAKLIGDKKTAAVASCFYTFSASSIFYSRNIWSAYIVIPFSLLVFFLFLKYLRESKFLYLILSCGLLLIASMINYSVLSYLIIFPIIALLHKKEKLIEILTVIPVILMILFLLNFPLFYYFGFEKVLAIIFTNGSQLELGNIVYLLIKNISLYFNSIFIIGGFPKSISLMIITLIIVSFFFRQRKSTILNKWLITFISIPIVLSLSLALAKKSIFDHYFTPIFPLFFIFIALLIRSLFRSLPSGKLIQLIVYPVIIYFLFIFFANYPNITNHPYHQNFSASENLSNRIIFEVQKIQKINNLADTDFFHLIFITNEHNRDSAMIWYFLEEKMHRSIVRIDDSKDVNLIMTNRPEIVFLICESTDPNCPTLFPRYYRGYNPNGMFLSLKNENFPYKYEVYAFTKGLNIRIDSID